MRHHPMFGLAISLLAGGVLMAAACGPLWAAEGQAAEDPEAHYAKGEVKYGDQWVSIDTLFRNYLDARGLLQGAADKVTAAREKQQDVQRRITQLKSDAAAAERPTRVEFGKARNKQREYNKALDAKPPQRPTHLQTPPQPRQPASSSSRGSSSYSGTGTGYDDQYDRYQQQLRVWQAQADAINRQNAEADKEYQQKMRDYKKAQDEAKKELPKVETAIKNCEAKLGQFASDLQTKQAPIIEEAKATNDDISTLQMQTQMAEKRVKNIADTMRGAPDSVRYQHGIVEWEGTFYTLAELDKLYTDTQAEINRLREQLKEETIKAGQPFPPGWRHPQQDRMDSLKAVLDKAKAVRPAAKPAA